MASNYVRVPRVWIGRHLDELVAAIGTKWTVRVCVFLVLFVAAVLHAEQAYIANNVLHFDAGAESSRIRQGDQPLLLDSTYTPELAFGWIEGPEHSFSRTELSRSHDAMEIDGVSGQRLKFRADVAPGSWYLTLYVEASWDDARDVNLLIQGRPQPLKWQAFRPPTEPTSFRRNTYRIYHGRAEVGAKGFTFELHGGREGIGLLGFSLVRQTESSQPDHRALEKQLAIAGKYKSGTPLGPLLDQVKLSLSEHPDDAFFAHWHQQLEHLALAERYLSMRCWEWAKEETGLGRFARLRQAVMLLDGLLNTEYRLSSPLSERALFVRARLLHGLGRQYHGPGERAGAQRDLKHLYISYPDDQLLRMYLGEKVDLPDPCDGLEGAAGAPAWSIAQREALCRLRQLTHWWVQERQAENGEFGGRFGDDVELLRSWVPLVLVGDETTQRGWQKLADGVWDSKYIHDGYARHVDDVEHAAEFVADTAPMMTVISDDQRYLNRLLDSARHFENLWTGLSPSGNRHFRSAWFSSTALETEPPKGRDLEYNSRAVAPIRYLAWHQRDPEIIQLLHEWSLAWVDAALRTDKGKPKGIIPASVRFEDEAINGDGTTWYRTDMYWHYFNWEHYAGGMMLEQLFFTYLLTGDKSLLEPMFLSLDLIRAEEPNLSEAPEEGSGAWAAQKLIESRLFWSVVEQWRFVTGDTSWDDLILRHGTEYARFRLSGDETHLNAGLDVVLDELRFNTPLRTTEVIHTDRVYVPNWEHLKAMLTGDGVGQSLSPYFGVTWNDTDNDFTALVTENSSDRFQAKLYSHAPDERPIGMRLWQLNPGEYRLISEAEGQENKQQLTIKSRGQEIRVTLPSKKNLTIGLQAPSAP